MPRGARRRSARDDEPERRDAPTPAPAGHVAEVLALQRSAGNRAVAAALGGRGPQSLARNASGAPPITDRKPIDDLAQQANVAPVDRVKAYARIAGTQALGMDPAAVNDKPIVQEGLNLGVLPTQDDKVGAQAGFVDAQNKFTGGAPPADAKGVAIVVNARSARFQDEDYMVAGIRHEMVHARLMKLTLDQRAAWQQKPGGKTFSQHVDQRLTGTDGALVKDRFFGGHMDETLAYAEGFLTAFFYAPVEEPRAGDRPWLAHLKGFTDEYRTARANSGPIPKPLPPGIDEHNLAIKQAANAVEAEAEKLVREFCDKGGAARRKNLAAWMRFLIQSGGMYAPALKMIHKAATP